MNIKLSYVEENPLPLYSHIVSPYSHLKGILVFKQALITLQKTDRLDSNSLVLGQAVSFLSSNLWWETIKSLFSPRDRLVITVQQL